MIAVRSFHVGRLEPERGVRDEGCRGARRRVLAAAVSSPVIRPGIPDASAGRLALRQARGQMAWRGSPRIHGRKDRDGQVSRHLRRVGTAGEADHPLRYRG
jgi:hypothetical protein